MFLRTGNTKRLTIDTDGKVGIGIDTPNRELEVYNNASQCSVAITAATTGQSSLWFADTADINVGGIYYEHSNDAMGFRVDNSSDKLRITNDKVMVGVDLKCDAHHSRDIGTASNAFRDIYGQTITVSTAYDSKGNVRSVPAKEPGNANYTLAATDAGKYVDSQGSGTTITVPANTFSQGDVVTILRATSGDCTIAQGSGVTMYHSADGANTTTGNRTLAQRGMATMIFVNPNYCYISGAGLS